MTLIMYQSFWITVFSIRRAPGDIQLLSSHPLADKRSLHVSIFHCNLFLLSPSFCRLLTMDVSSGYDYQGRQDAFFIVSCGLAALAAIAVFLRCIGRFILIRMPGPDDYFLIAAMVGIFGYMVGMFVVKNDHMGFPRSKLTPVNMVNFLKTALAIQIIYSATLACIKMSICFTYLRFAVANKFRYLCIGTIATHAIFFLICFIILLFQCQPMENVWDVTGTVQGTCINNSAFFYAAPGFHILTDIWILLLPMHTLKNIRRPNREKAALFAIFGVGAFAVAASCIRLHTILLYNLSDDKFRDALPVNLWTMIETTVAVICASVPGLKPIFSRWRRHGGRETNSQNMGASKLPELLRRREERKQQHTDVTLDGLPGEEMRPTPAAEVSVMQPRGAVPAATLGGDGGGGWDGGDGSGPSAVRYSGISNAGSHLTSPSLHQGRYSSQECIMREPAPVDRAEAGDPPSWPLGPANNV
ncbi:hypothetical protein RB593_006874 [Gaeumannomyces tritici]